MFAPTSPENAEIIRKLQTALSELPLGQSVSYDRLRQIAGRDVRSRHRHLLTAAQEATERDLGCVFATVRNVGIKRLASAEAPSIGLAALRRCRAAAKRGLKRLSRLNVNSLNESEQRSTIGYRAMLGAVHMLSDGRKASAIAVVADPAKPIPPQNILEMFKSDGGPS